MNTIYLRQTEKKQQQQINRSYTNIEVRQQQQHWNKLLQLPFLLSQLFFYPQKDGTSESFVL